MDKTLAPGSDAWMRKHGFAYDPKGTGRRPRWVNRMSGIDVVREPGMSDAAWHLKLEAAVDSSEAVLLEKGGNTDNKAIRSESDAPTLAQTMRRLNWGRPTGVGDDAYPLSGGKKKKDVE